MGQSLPCHSLGVLPGVSRLFLEKSLVIVFLKVLLEHYARTDSRFIFIPLLYHIC
jgi:hypothetical protein